MPNWCNNFIEINASPSAINQLLQKARGAVSPGDNENAEFSYLPFVVDALPKNYEEDWYQSNCEILGSKWFPYIAVVDLDGGQLTLSFDSAWSPTTTGTKYLAEWLRDNVLGEFLIVHSYEEPGLAFCGELVVSHSGTSEQYGELIELDLEEIKLRDEAELINFCLHIGVSQEQLHDWISEARDEPYLRFIPEFYANYSRDGDIPLPPPKLVVT